MRQCRSTLPVVALALVKALDQLALAHTAARISDEDLAVKIAAAAAELEALRAKATSIAARDTKAAARCPQTGGRRNAS